jgi:hypothetical protein
VAIDDRSALHAYLSEAAHEAWTTLSEDNGVSTTAILEALGQELIDEIKENGGSGVDLRLDWIRAARRIDAQRRRRGRGGRY